MERPGTLTDDELKLRAKEWLLAGYQVRAWFRGKTREGVNSTPSVTFKAEVLPKYAIVCAIQDGTLVAYYERGQLGWRKM